MPALPLRIEAPAVQAAPFNLLDTIRPQSLPEKGGLAGISYEADYCGPAKPWVRPCVDSGGDVKEATDGIGEVEGQPITVYHLSSCRLPGSGDAADRDRRARRALDLGASRAVEEGFGQVIGTAATDVTPGGTAVRVKVGLALLEQFAGNAYGGVPVIHMDRASAILAIGNGMVERVGDHLETGLGSLVIAGAGYGGLQVPSVPAAGSSWMYATGAVNVWEGDTIATGTVLNTPYDNQYYVLAERLYVPTYECFAAAVEVNVTEA